MITRFLALVLVASLSGVSFGRSPILTHAVPSAVVPGKTTTVTFFGEHLEGVTGLWTSFPAKVQPGSSIETTNAGPDKAVFHLSIPKNVQVGIYAVQLATTNGLSDLHLFMVDDLPTIEQDGTNHGIAAAQELKPPVAIDGETRELGFDYYKFHARKGRHISVEVVANRLGFALDAVVRLIDASGKELVYADDDPALGADSRFSFAIPVTGEYVIEIHDLAYQGGPNYRYRLRVGDFPLVSASFPAGARAGARAKIAFVGPDADRVRPLALSVPTNATLVPLSVKRRRGGGSGFATLAASRLPELLEAEPNDISDKATRISVPCVVNGRFIKPKDRDWFEFSTGKGQRLIFTGMTRSLGSPCDLFMRLYDAAGKKLAEANVSGANEGALTNKFTEAGAYRLLVEELNRGGESDFVYRIEVAPFQPGFALTVETNRVEAAANGVFEIKVEAARREYDGPIALSIAGLGDDFALENNVVAEKKKQAELKVKLPEHAQAGQLFHFRIVGKAKVGDSDFETTASTMPALKGLWPLRRYPPAELDGLIGLGIRDADQKTGNRK